MGVSVCRGEDWGVDELRRRVAYCQKAQRDGADEFGEGDCCACYRHAGY